MSYVALVTDQFEKVAEFYGQLLNFPLIANWDRSDARGKRFDLNGMRLEVVDNQRKNDPLSLGKPSNRSHIVIEVENIEDVQAQLKLQDPTTKATSWGAKIFVLHDPDGVPVTFLEWLDETISGRTVSGQSKGQHFTRIEWARRQFIEKLKIDPFPGTLNLLVEDNKNKEAWERIKRRKGIIIKNPKSGQENCNARCYPIRVFGQLEAAIVVPEVLGYPENQIEIIAPCGIRDAFGIGNNDPIHFDYRPSGENG